MGKRQRGIFISEGGLLLPLVFLSLYGGHCPPIPYSYPIRILSVTHSHVVPELKRRVQQPHASEG